MHNFRVHCLGSFLGVILILLLSRGSRNKGSSKAVCGPVCVDGGSHVDCPHPNYFRVIPRKHDFTGQSVSMKGFHSSSCHLSPRPPGNVQLCPRSPRDHETERSVWLPLTRVTSAAGKKILFQVNSR